MYRTLLNRSCLSQIFPRVNIHLSTPKVEEATSSKDVQQKSSTSTNDEVKFDYKNKTGIIQLNKPKALNALSLSMIEKIYPKMKEWESDGKTELVIVKSTIPKAFCAGGDIKAIMNKTAEGNKHAEEFFRKEYTLNYLTGNYKLPYVAIINGITMGGGVGLSVHGPFRIATETTTIAMPETAIGLFPDVGGSHFLPRLSNNLGVFLGLTGYRLRGIDVLHAGFATHFVPTNRLEEVERKLVEIPKANYNSVKDVLDKSSESVNSHASFSLQDQLPLINRVFSIDTKNVETILERLKSDGSDFALKQLATLEKMSPTSLKLTFEQLKRGQKLDLKDCLIMEYRLAQNTMIGHDFYEGVRAVLVDKDNKPQWKPNSLKNVSDKEIEDYFKKPSSNEDLQI
ncbi:unnamed protein product [Adineta steineri]|uniref:3-hydroxyisobutyryl-CoA hydrolase, mitochondrial n=1 Tax=Adineta steineri TaxID=433720 RepID=A0A814SPN8_9BILA|nr:unnamed protein product [Adineta steineri]CAF1149455.1 unnamed protein product [Adineta steineri]CAF1151240.1 unnamed protein product [Adineta steineri]